MDWLKKVIYENTGQENTHTTDKILAAAIREEIKKRRPLDGIESYCDGGTGAVHNLALANYDKALGIK